MTVFKKLNANWDAEPNSPMPEIAVSGNDVILTFHLNDSISGTEKCDKGQLHFKNCTRYRLGHLNDEGWYRCQGRFDKNQHAWGEFYEISGDLRLEDCPDDWISVGKHALPQKHFLFYFRDEDFECNAESWTFSVCEND